jgi:predicted MPP superfamily phosphohydrolase
MRVAWLTDIHLNFLTRRGVDDFLASIRAIDADAILLGGDIGEANNVAAYLRLMAQELQRPIYFVLGNHDFYRGSIAEVRAAISRLCRETPWLQWLPESGVVGLTESTALAGHDSWADGRLGDFYRMPLVLNDYYLIEELRDLSHSARLGKLHHLGDEAAEYLRSVVPAASRDYRRVILLTHVPPFRESCWHEGRISSDEWLPHFSCKAAGDVLLEVMKARPDCELTVLCGHSHGEGEARILPNLVVRTGGAVYGSPRVQTVLELA